MTEHVEVHAKIAAGLSIVVIRRVARCAVVFRREGIMRKIAFVEYLDIKISQEIRLEAVDCRKEPYHFR